MMADEITPPQHAVIDAVFVEWSTFAMPKELREALNTLHQRVRALGVAPTTDQGELTFSEPKR
jgi:hypothetical protein